MSAAVSFCNVEAGGRKYSRGKGGRSPGCRVYRLGEALAGEQRDSTSVWCFEGSHRSLGKCGQVASNDRNPSDTFDQTSWKSMFRKLAFNFATIVGAGGVLIRYLTWLLG